MANDQDVKVELKLYRPFYERLRRLASYYCYSESFEDFLIDCLRHRMLELEKKHAEQCWEIIQTSLIEAFTRAAAKRRMTVKEFVDKCFAAAIEA